MLPSYVQKGAFFLIGYHFSIRALRVGVSVMAANTDVTIVIVTIIPSCLNRTPVRPLINVNGKKTATTVRVVTITASHTSLVA